MGEITTDDADREINGRHRQPCREGHLERQGGGREEAGAKRARGAADAQHRSAPSRRGAVDSASQSHP